MSPLEPLTQAPFSGSYAPEDVTFLLKPLELTPTPLEQKERLIQSGAVHYSQMLSLEAVPSRAYLELFYEALERNGERLARDLHLLANLIEREREGDITLISLARGGTPIGILLRRELERRALSAPHFSVSIIRDRGLDQRALEYLLERGFHPRSWTFVDGWSAKGVIGRELGSSLEKFNLERGTKAKPELFVVSDLFGGAAFSATRDDYLIPSSLLNATVSGLISRSVLNEQLGPGDFHGCVRLEHLREHDLSRFFVDAVWARMLQIGPTPAASSAPPALPPARAARDFPARDFLDRLAFERSLPMNHLKPGIGESTRALLRRVPESVLLREPGNPEVAHLVHLARDKGVTLETVPNLPCLALALIARLEPSES